MAAFVCGGWMVLRKLLQGGYDRDCGVSKTKGEVKLGPRQGFPRMWCSLPTRAQNISASNFAEITTHAAVVLETNTCSITHVPLQVYLAYRSPSAPQRKVAKQATDDS